MASKAYTQAVLASFEGTSETWIELPEDQWQKSWKGRFKRPVVRLLRNLYGHPLAGLYWERHCHDAITKCGFERVHGWECLYKHYAKQLFLSVYVDDFKMAGKTANLSGMWETLKKYSQLDLSLIHI